MDPCCKVKKSKATKKKKRVKPPWSGVRFYNQNGELDSLGRQDFLRGVGGGGVGGYPVETIILRRRTSNNLTPGALALLPAVLCGNFVV